MSQFFFFLAVHRFRQVFGGKADRFLVIRFGGFAGVALVGVVRGGDAQRVDGNVAFVLVVRVEDEFLFTVFIPPEKSDKNSIYLNLKFNL